MTITAGDLYEQIRAEVAEHPDRRPVEDRLRDFGDMTPILCGKAGLQPTHEDLDAIEVMVRFAQRAGTP